MGQIVNYAIMGAIAIGLAVVVGKYLLSLGKNKEIDFSLKIEEDKPTPTTELKLEVVKAEPSEPASPEKKKAKKIAAKKPAAAKTAAKKPAVAKKTKTVKNT